MVAHGEAEANSRFGRSADAATIATDRSGGSRPDGFVRARRPRQLDPPNNVAITPDGQKPPRGLPHTSLTFVKPINAKGRRR